jgi:hypothetical protein
MFVVVDGKNVEDELVVKLVHQPCERTNWAARKEGGGKKGAAAASTCCRTSPKGRCRTSEVIASRCRCGYSCIVVDSTRPILRNVSSLRVGVRTSLETACAKEDLGDHKPDAV